MILTDKITIGFPYDIKSWLIDEIAISEASIDWATESDKTVLCTESYAVSELTSHLKQMLPELRVEYLAGKEAINADIIIGSKEISDIPMRFPDGEGADESFIIKTVKINNQEKIIIRGKTRIGTLYGVYAFLENLGFRWFRPEDYGVFIPVMERIELPHLDIAEKPDYFLFRGFSIESEGKARYKMFIWMARNRLNLWADQPGYVPLMRKLGIKLLDGGHIFKEIIHPELKLKNGKAQFEKHPEWFAEVNGKRTLDIAKSHQFCTANKEAVNFLAEGLIEAISKKYPNADFLNLWGYDTWGGICECPECRGLGNGTDRYIRLIAEIREAINHAVKSGKLRKNPHILLAVYEGTSTLEAPVKALPEGFDSDMDSVTFFPINRCYQHNINDMLCKEINKNYNDTFNTWKNSSYKGKWVIGEYYNVSKFEDLPLVFYNTMSNDIKYYYALGIRGIHYMHVPLGNWGVRSLTNYLLAKLSWDVNAGAEAIISDYFDKSYGKEAKTMREFYDCLKEAYANVAVWRNWAAWSVTHIIQDSKPANYSVEKPLFPTLHLKLNKADSCGKALGPSGEESLERLARARKLINKSLKSKTARDIKKRIIEDETLFSYGENSMLFYYWCASYCLNKQSKNESSAKDALKKAIPYANSLMNMEIPWPGIFGDSNVSYNGLAKTQIGDAYRIWLKKIEGMQER